MATDEVVKLVLRLPKHLHATLKKEAKRDNVSLNTEIIQQLEGYEVKTVQRTVGIVDALLKEAVKEAAKTAASVTYEILKKERKAENE